MSREAIIILIIGLFLSGIGTGLLGCAKSEEKANDSGEASTAQKSGPTEGGPSASAQVSPLLPAVITPSPLKPSPAPSPTATEVSGAVARVFEQVAVPGAPLKPSFVIGDFNGDGAEDLAVVVKPNPDKLGDMNNEFANWTLEDPNQIVLPRSNLAVPMQKKSGPVHAEKSDLLLAIIHGVGSEGWRNAESKQTFLLKNGAGTNMIAQSARSLKESKDKQKLPFIKGDAIREAIGGKPGLIIWTGAKYAWYSPAVP